MTAGMEDGIFPKPRAGFLLLFTFLKFLSTGSLVSERFEISSSTPMLNSPIIIYENDNPPAQYHLERGGGFITADEIY